MTAASTEDLERLAVAQFIFKSIAAEVETAKKCGDGIRAKVDRELQEMWEQTGSDRLTLAVAGVKVGSITLKTDEETEVDDAAAFEAFLLEKGFAKSQTAIDDAILTQNQFERLLGLVRIMAPSAVREYVTVDRKWKNQVERTPDGSAIWSETGELVPGVKMRTVPNGTTLRLDEKKVAPLLARVGGTVKSLTGIAEPESEPEPEYEVEEA